MLRTFVALVALAAVMYSVGCTRRPVENRAEALRPISTPELADDLDLESLKSGLTMTIKKLQEFPDKVMTFGEREISYADYAKALESLSKFDPKNPQDFWDRLEADFQFYEVYGSDSWGKVFITSYYEPILEGSSKKNEKHPTPLYKTPKDLVDIYLRGYGEKYKERPKFLRGRETKDKTFSGLKKIVPYYTRKEIDQDLSLKGRNLEICYLDPLDAFVLQIQGSGSISLDGGKRQIRVGYAERNGREYHAIGKFLTDHIPLEEMTLQKIEDHLRTLPREEMQEILNKNESYVFFRKLESRPIANWGTEVIDGRTIAVDERYFPKGALAFMNFEKPVFDSESNEPKWQKTSRLVFDHDRGGAVRGGGRVDLYWGSGDEAKKHAGVVKSEGRLWYIAPRQSMDR